MTKVVLRHLRTPHRNRWLKRRSHQWVIAYTQDLAKCRFATRRYTYLWSVISLPMSTMISTLPSTGMRGMVSAESNMNHFARRLRKQGRSWCREGLQALIRVMIKCFDGTLARYTQGLANTTERLDLRMLEIGASQIVTETVEKASDVTGKAHRMSIREAGCNASRSLSAFMNRLNRALPPQLT